MCGVPHSVSFRLIGPKELPSRKDWINWVGGWIWLHFPFPHLPFHNLPFSLQSGLCEPTRACGAPHFVSLDRKTAEQKDPESRMPATPWLGQFSSPRKILFCARDQIVSRACYLYRETVQRSMFKVPGGGAGQGGTEQKSCVRLLALSRPRNSVTLGLWFTDGSQSGPAVPPQCPFSSLFSKRKGRKIG